MRPPRQQPKFEPPRFSKQQKRTGKNGTIVFLVWVVMTITLAAISMPISIIIVAPGFIAAFLWFLLEHNMQPDDVVNEMFKYNH